MSTLIETLEASLRDDGTEIRLSARVKELERLAVASPDARRPVETVSGTGTAGLADGSRTTGTSSEAGTAGLSGGAGAIGPAGVRGAEGAYRLRLADGATLDADAVLFALPAFATAPLLAPHSDVGALEAIRYVSVANVVFAYEDERKFNHKLDGSGFLVPHSEGRTITASTWTSSKWKHTAPEGKRLIRCYVGWAGDESGVELTDEEMSAAVKRDLRELMGLAAEPAFVEITRLRHSMPQYPVGHVDRIAAFRAGLAERLPGVLATGHAFGGVGLPDCVEQGREAAEQLLALRA
ncbi:protoporphyrinogen oxidase [Cohnella nanjingensis]|uniref:Coproporphyrinogen III oxidase n=1 Tax=Cohnella nanjingensis TaxID=1387779 RepID=A0A7X0RUM7_9BACL|nr:protoporphyrinogen oxidase [Cohnella nanjingensis]